MNNEHLWTSIHLIKNIVEAIDRIEDGWEHGSISGSRPAHLKEAVTEATKAWYQNYLCALSRTVKEIEKEALKLEALKESRNPIQSKEGEIK